METIYSGVIKSRSRGLRSCWPSVAGIGGGLLAAVYSGGRHAHICPYGRVEMSLSSDGGRTWSRGKTIFDTPLDDRDAGIAVWKNRIVVTSFNNSVRFQRECLAKWSDGRSKDETDRTAAYLDSVTEEEENANLGSVIMFSEEFEDAKSLIRDITRNGGKIRFVKCKKLPVTSPHGPVVLNDDRLFYAGKAFSADQTWTDTGLGKFLYVMTASEPDGWSLPVKLPYPDDCELFEPHAAEYGNGKILIAARARSKDGDETVMLSRSEDSGRSFTAFAETGFEGLPPHLCRLKDGKILLTYCRRKPPYAICARISSDGGRTWTEEYRLREDGIDWDIGYPASAELDDGSVCTVYYFSTAKDPVPQIHYTLWSP